MAGESNKFKQVEKIDVKRREYHVHGILDFGLVGVAMVAP